MQQAGFQSLLRSLVVVILYIKRICTAPAKELRLGGGIDGKWPWCLFLLNAFMRTCTLREDGTAQGDRNRKRGVGKEGAALPDVFCFFRYAASRYQAYYVLEA